MILRESRGLAAGDVGFLISTEASGGRLSYTFSRQPGRTKRLGRPVLRGILEMTGGRTVAAEGLWRVLSEVEGGAVIESIADSGEIRRELTRLGPVAAELLGSAER